MISKLHTSNARGMTFVDGGGGTQDLIDMEVGSVQSVVDARVFDALDDDCDGLVWTSFPAERKSNQ
jgi:hypothetical protein